MGALFSVYEVYLGECHKINIPKVNCRYLQSSNTCLNNNCVRVLENIAHARQG